MNVWSRLLEKAMVLSNTGLTDEYVMKRFWYGSLFLALLVLFLPVRTFAQCGVERWSVKTGTDPDSGLINLNSPTATTIASLTAIAAPGSLPDNQRVQPVETTLWVLNATLTKFVLAYDSDYHMVLTDGAGRTMIAEIPSPNCVGPGSPLAAAIAHARTQFDAMFTATTAFQTVNIPVQITGVGFFDYLEGQEGVAPNGIELHPVIDILFNPNFSLSSSVSSMTVSQGSTGSATITSTLSGSFNSSIALSASGLPAGATATFSPSSIAAPGSDSSILTISVGASTPVGTYAVTVSGSGGGQTHTTSLNLTVTTGGSTVQQLFGNTGFENGPSNPAPWTVTSGVIDNSSFQAPHTGSWKAWLNGYGSAHTDTLLQIVSIPSTATNAALSFWLHIDTAETANAANDTLNVQVRNSSGTVLSTLATYSNRDKNTGYRQVAFDLTSYKGQTVQIYLIGVENSKLKTSFVVDDFALNATTSGTPAGDFAISASPSTLAINQGSSGAATITTALSGSFNSSIALSASGLPAGATATFSPSSVAAPGASALTISVGASTAVGTYSVTITGTGGGKTHTATLSLTVNSSGGGGTTQQLLGNTGFENGSSNPAPWTVTAGVIDSNSTSEPPHSGTWKAWLNGYGSAHTDTLWQSANISSAATTATLSLWLHIDTTETSTTAAYDTLKIQIRNSSGTVLGTLASYSNLSAKAGYAQVSFDLTAYKGQTIQIYLVGVEDSSLKTSFVVDDFLLNVTTP
jgi:uncharacterized protein YfaP (DUF2135 family)